MQSRASVLVLLMCVSWSCGPADENESGVIETVDVTPGRTSVLTTAYDKAAPPRDDSFTGVLPQGFPPDLPLYDPSSLTDFGDAERGRLYVLMFTPDAATMVRSRMESKLKRSGWALIRGSSSQGTYRRGSQTVELAIQNANPGTEIRVEY